MKKLPFAKKKKLRPLRLLKKDVWDVFARWVRQRGGDGKSNFCISCGKIFPINGKALNAGHYIHGKWTKKSGLDERNVWAQCTYCNLGLAGNQSAYKEALLLKIGPEGIDAIQALSKQIWKPTRDELEEIKKKYSEVV